MCCSHSVLLYYYMQYYSVLPFLNNIGTYDVDSEAKMRCVRYNLSKFSCQIRVQTSNGSCSNGLLVLLIPE